MQDRALDHQKVKVHFNTTVDDAYPDGKGALAGLHIKDTKTGQIRTIPCYSASVPGNGQENGVCHASLSAYSP